MNATYRIYFSTPNGDLDPSELVGFTAADGFTLYKGIGMWLGQLEPAFVLEIIGTPDDEADVRDTAKLLKARFRQEAVLVTRSTISGELI